MSTLHSAYKRVVVVVGEMTATAKVSDSMSLLWGTHLKRRFQERPSHVRDRQREREVSTLAYGRVGVLDYATQPRGVLHVNNESIYLSCFSFTFAPTFRARGGTSG